MADNFNSFYSHGFVRVAVCVPNVRVADPEFNTAQTTGLATRASDAGAAVALFPELGISSYAIDDLLQQEALLEAVQSGIRQIVEASRQLTPVLLIGAPLRFENRLFNCAVVIHRGQVLGIVPKTYLPSYREFYETRQFSAARHAIGREVQFLGKTVPFGNDLLFKAVSSAVEDGAEYQKSRPHPVQEPAASADGRFVLHVEICEDVWTPIPPSNPTSIEDGSTPSSEHSTGSPFSSAEHPALIPIAGPASRWNEACRPKVSCSEKLGLARTVISR